MVSTLPACPTSAAPLSTNCSSWYDGELRSLDDDSVVPGVLAFDVRRRDARGIAQAVGVNQFIWGTSGAPVEAHDSKIFEDDGDRSWKSARARAFVGLSDMWASARHLSLEARPKQSSLRC
jgi:hypothetical protein